ncbi:hypothetical protein GCK32_020240, partial [Trichostrongylus colubriformis]
MSTGLLLWTSISSRLSVVDLNPNLPFYSRRLRIPPTSLIYLFKPC